VKITRPMLEELLALTVPGDGDDEPVEMTLRHMEDGPEGPGLYAYYSEYPEEGVTLIDGKSDVLRAEGRASIEPRSIPDGWRLIPPQPMPDMIGSMAFIEPTAKGERGRVLLGMGGAEEAYAAVFQHAVEPAPAGVPGTDGLPGGAK
jgi:hypothetical protein